MREIAPQPQRLATGTHRSFKQCSFSAVLWVACCISAYLIYPESTASLREGPGRCGGCLRVLLVMSNGSWCGGFVCAPGVASLFEGVEIVVYKPGLKRSSAVPAVALIAFQGPCDLADPQNGGAKNAFTFLCKLSRHWLSIVVSTFPSVALLESGLLSIVSIPLPKVATGLLCLL